MDKKIKNVTKLVHKSTSAHSFQVNMIVQIFAEDEDTARKILDEQGGYVTRRDVKIIESIKLYNGINEEK